MISPSSILQPQPSIASRILDGEAVLVHPVEGKVKVINEVGAFIWAQLDGFRSVDEIAANICTEYRVDRSTAEADLMRFLESLLDRNLVTFVEQQKIR